MDTKLKTDKRDTSANIELEKSVHTLFFPNTMRSGGTALYSKIKTKTSTYTSSTHSEQVTLRNITTNAVD